MRILLAIILSGATALAIDCVNIATLLEATPLLATATMQRDGVQPLDVAPLSAEATERIFQALLAGGKTGRLLPGTVEGRVQLPPEHTELAQYLNAVIAQARAAMGGLPGSFNTGSPRIDIRWADEGTVYPVDTAAQRGHIDGSFSTAAGTLIGPTTIVYVGQQAISPTVGVPVLMTGREGATRWSIPGTYHQTPPLPGRPRRLFFQILW